MGKRKGVGEKKKALKFHEVSSIFPLMDGEPFAELVQDIRDHGLQDPITTYEGKIVDGRNRYRACKEAAVEPKFEEWHANGSSLTDFVVSRNKHRRHLTVQQRQRVAGRTAGRGHPKHDEKASCPESASCGEATDQAGKAFGVSGRTVARAAQVLEHGSEKLKAAVEAEEIPLTTAAKLAELPKSEQNEAIEGGKLAIKEAVSDSFRQIYGAMTSIKRKGLKEFIASWTQKEREEWSEEINRVIKVLTEWRMELK